MNSAVTVFTQPTSTAIATAEGVIAYDSVADLLKVCDGTTWVSLGGGGGGSSQWTTTGSDIYYNTGNVGIGTATPSYPLHLSSAFGTTGITARIQDVGAQTRRFDFDAYNATIETGYSGGFFAKLYLDGSLRVVDTGNTGQTLFRIGNGIVFTNKISSGNGITGLTYSPLILQSNHWGITTASPAIDFQVFRSDGGGANLSKLAIYNGDSGNIVLQSNGLGNVGIGTTSPTNLLSLGGDAARTIWMERSATAAATGNSLTLQAGGTKSGNTDQNGGDLVLSSGTATGTGSSNITFKTALAGTTGTTDRAPATAMTILGNGNVGIGTTSPAHLLDVNGRINSNNIMSVLRDGSDTIGSGAALFLGNVASTRVWAQQLSASNNLDMWNWDGSVWGRKVTFQNTTGNVGIGITSPSAKLEVASGQAYTVATEIARFSFDTTNNRYARIRNSNTDLIIDTSAAGMKVGPSGGDVLDLQTQGTSRINISSLGLVGIGSAADSVARLRVNGGYIINQPSSNTANGEIGRYGFSPTSYDAKNVAYMAGFYQGASWPDGSQLRFYTHAGPDITVGSPTERVRIDKDGNVGIGTTNPDQAKLEVKGGTVCVDTNSDDNATACITFESDIRLKKNIELIPHALDTLVKLRGVFFDWRWDEIPAIADYKAIGRDAGVIAQEVEAIFPQGMGEDLNGYKTVRYDRLVPLLIESVKELKAANDNLAAQAARHEVEIEALREEIRAK